MLYLSVFTYEPDKRDAVVRKRMETGLKAPGVKVLGQWSYLGLGRVFTLTDTDDPVAVFKMMAPYGNLGKFEVFPVMETTKVMELIAAT
jgi:hypothetical protein